MTPTTPPGYTSLYPPGVFVVLALFEYWISTLTSSGGTKVRGANFCSVKKAKPVIQHTNNATLSNPQNRCFFTAKYVLCSKKYRTGVKWECCTIGPRPSHLETAGTGRSTLSFRISISMAPNTAPRLPQAAALLQTTGRQRRGQTRIGARPHCPGAT